jgi:signal transduction histidine kinase/ligand-binding sensor domain-containing protein
VADAMVRRNFGALRTLLTLILLAWGSHAFALDPTLDVSQYAHKSWKIREGFVQGFIGAIAQTPDGYLWLGTEFGLVRFDGVRPFPLQLPLGQSLPDPWVRSLLTAKDGTLWIGTLKGLASWKDGRLISYEKLAGFAVDQLLQDHTGRIWAAAQGIPTGRLCEIENNTVEVCHGEDGVFGRYLASLYEDGKGKLWLGTLSGLWQWKPGPSQFYPMKSPVNGPQSILESDNDGLTIVTAGGIQKFVDGRFERYPLRIRGEPRFNKMLRDRNGNLWIGTSYKGLTHIHRGRTDEFSRSNGLSGDSVMTMFEDREGNIWVATNAGLDRFRETAVSTISKEQGLSAENTWSVLATKNGSVWLGTPGGLNIWTEGKIQVLNTPKRNDIFLSLFQDRQGRTWVVKLDSLGYMDNGKFITIPGVPGGQVRSIAEDSEGNLWFCNLDRGLVRVSATHEVQIIPWSRLGHQDFANVAIADPSGNGLWLGFYKGGILRLTDSQTHESYAAANGLGEGRVNALHFDRKGTLWVSTESGLSRLSNGRLVTLTRSNGLPCDGVHWLIEDDEGAFWLYMPCGLVRIAAPALDAWVAAAESGSKATPILQTLILDASDGVRTRSAPSGYSPTVAKLPDGKFWFVSDAGVSVVDPLHLPFNKLAPPVRIEQIIANRQPIDVLDKAAQKIHLPPRTGDLVIEYTALNLAAPEKTRFRYKLENHDRDWQDAGNRRYALYGKLDPGDYRFRVIAANESGVWNEAGAFLDFSVDPAYYETTWFRLSVVAAFLMLLAALYQLRLRQVAQHYNIRLDERVNERTRIARDLHDTLLQSFQGVLLKFHAITYLLPDRGADAKAMLETTIEEARRAVTEGRDTVQKLRSSTIPGNNLAAAIGAFGDELSTNFNGAERPSFELQVEGNPRELAPTLKDEIFRIASEAVRNAFRHSDARNIEVEIRYDHRHFRLRVRDDGKGIDSTVLAAGGRDLHYGLAGMQERAKAVGGKFTIWSKLDSGTEIELLISAKVAYRKATGKTSA